MVRRFAMLALSLALMLGLNGASFLLAQDTKKDEAKAAEPKAAEPKKDEAKKDEPKVAEPKKEEPLPPIPPDVEKKLDEARKAVAVAIVAAQDAGLVKSSIDPPPILDILITGRATDEASLKARTGVSPEVFGAWFTGYGKSEGVTAQSDVRILPPSGGLKDWYDKRNAFLVREIEAVRKAKGPAPKAAEAKKDEPKAAEVKKDEAKKDEPKAAEVKKDEAKKDEAKKDEAKAAEAKKDEAKAAEAKKDEAKAAEVKKDEAKKDEAKKDEPKADEKK